MNGMNLHLLMKLLYNMNSIKIIKFTITLFFLFSTYFIIYCIFSKNFVHEGLVYSVDSWKENQFLIMINSTWMSMIAVICLGTLSIFTNFVFVRLVYSNEIKESALILLKEKQNKSKPSPIDTIFDQINKSRENIWQTILYKVQNIFK